MNCHASVNGKMEKSAVRVIAAIIAAVLILIIVVVAIIVVHLPSGTGEKGN